MLFVYIRIPLFWWYTGKLVDVAEEVVESAEDGACLEVFVHVPGEDDVGVGGVVEDVGDEVLRKPFSKDNSVLDFIGIWTYSGDVHLMSPPLAMSVHGRTSISM